jgi:hypothetical protein
MTSSLDPEALLAPERQALTALGALKCKLALLYRQ